MDGGWTGGRVHRSLCSSTWCNVTVPSPPCRTQVSRTLERHPEQHLTTSSLPRPAEPSPPDAPLPSLPSPSLQLPQASPHPGRLPLLFPVISGVRHSPSDRIVFVRRPSDEVGVGASRGCPARGTEAVAPPSGPWPMAAGVGAQVFTGVHLIFAELPSARRGFFHLGFAL